MKRGEASDRHSQNGSPAEAADLIIVGGGILGLASAREMLSRHPGMNVVVLEREERIAAHQTGHSSGVIHAGIYYEPGSLKARLCVSGARALYAYCENKGIPFKRSGKVIVAVDEEELPRLDELERRGRANEVPGLQRIDTAELSRIEPKARGIAALHSPETGVVDFAVVADALAEDVRDAGGAVLTGVAVTSSSAAGPGIAVEHRSAGGRRTTSAPGAIFCAGAWSDRLAVAAGAPRDPRIVPFRGGYLKLREGRRELVRTAIYPVPDPDLPFLGMHLTRTIDGEVLLGPSALMVGARDAYGIARVRPRDVASNVAWPGTWRLALHWWRTGVREMRAAASRRAFVAELARYVPELTAADVIAGPSGVRAQALGRDGRLVDDFIVHSTERAIHVRNAPSPAATSSLELAKLIVDRAEAELDLGS